MTAIASLNPVSSNGVARGELSPKDPIFSVNKLSAVLIATTSSGIRVAIKPKTEEQAARLEELYRRIFPVAEEQEHQHRRFHLNSLASDVGGQKRYEFSSDDTVVKELRKLAEEITGYSDTPWDVYSSGSRVAENAPMSLVRNEIPKDYNKAGLKDDPEIGSEIVERVHEKLDDSRNLLAELAKDLQDIDRKKAIEAAQDKLNRIQDDAIIFACAYKGKDLKTRWEEAKEKLQLDKDRNYLEDVVRLTCETRAEYIQESKELENLENFPEPPPPPPSTLQRIKSWFSSKQEEKPIPKDAGVHRSDGLEFFFVRLIGDENIEQLLDSSLFAKAFSDLHPVDLDALRAKFKEANKEVFQECEEISEKSSEEPSISIQGPSSESDTAEGPGNDSVSDSNPKG